MAGIASAVITGILQTTALFHRQSTRYRAHWLVARTAEHIGGWATRPLPLPDMVYAATAADMGHHRELIEDAVLGVEEDLDQERP